MVTAMSIIVTLVRVFCIMVYLLCTVVLLSGAIEPLYGIACNIFKWDGTIESWKNCVPFVVKGIVMSTVLILLTKKESIELILYWLNKIITL